MLPMDILILLNWFYTEFVVKTGEIAENKIKFFTKILLVGPKGKQDIPVSLTSTFDSTQTDRPVLTFTFRNKKVKLRAGLSVCVLSNVDFVSQIQGHMAFC